MTAYAARSPAASAIAPARIGPDCRGRRPAEHDEAHHGSPTQRRAVRARGGERVDDRVHRRPRRRPQEDERDRGDRRGAAQHEDDRQTRSEVRQTPPTRNVAERSPSRATIALTTVYTAEATENRSPISPADTPFAFSWSGTSRLTPPPTRPISTMIAMPARTSSSRRTTRKISRSDCVRHVRDPSREAPRTARSSPRRPRSPAPRTAYPSRTDPRLRRRRPGRS